MTVRQFKHGSDSIERLLQLGTGKFESSTLSLVTKLCDTNRQCCVEPTEASHWTEASHRTRSSSQKYVSKPQCA